VKLGADQAINYKRDDFGVAIAADSVDVVLDMVGGDYVARNLKLLRQEGRHVSIAFQNGKKAEIDINLVMQKRLIITGSTLRSRPVHEKAELARAIREKVWPLIEAGKIKPVIDAVFPLAEAYKAHERLEQGAHIGKIVLKLV